MSRLSVLAPVVVAVIGVVAICNTPAAAAQEASPAASLAACTVAPRPVNQLIGFWYGPGGTPVATPLPASPMASAAELPRGNPADAATVAAITATTQEAIACGNAGEFARQLALFTDHLARQFGPEQGTTEAQSRAFLSTHRPVPPDQQVTFLGLREARVLPDGRVGALLEANDPTQHPTHQTAFLVFVRNGDRWLVDEFMPLPPEATPVAGTPTA